MTESAVRVRGLVKRYGAVTALRGLDLTVATGSVFALLGPNGAGKSTTIELCQGFLRPDEGRVEVLGLDPVSAGQRLRPRVGVMPQDGGAYPGVRADEMLRLIATCAANPLDVEWLLETLGLSRARRTPYKRLSGGQRQRLSLACAVVGRPELVFLDEPTAGLDPQARGLVWELIRALRADGVSVVLTTHLMDEAERLADQIAIIDQGTLVAVGTPEELTGAGLERSLRFTSRPGLDLSGLIVALPGDCRVEETAPGDYLVTGEIDPRVIAAVTAWCAGLGALAERMTVGRRSLEDVFLDLTGRELRT